MGWEFACSGGCGKICAPHRYDGSIRCFWPAQAQARGVWVWVWVGRRVRRARGARVCVHVDADNDVDEM